MTSSLEEWPTKIKEVPSLHEVRLTPLDTNPVFQCFGDNPLWEWKSTAEISIPPWKYLILYSTDNILEIVFIPNMINADSKSVRS